MSFSKKTISGLATWLEGTGLEKFLLGQNFIKLLVWQFAYYKIFFGDDFDLNWDEVAIDASRLDLIATGLKSGAVNYPLLVCTPATIPPEKKDWTETQYFFEQLFQPLQLGTCSIFGNSIPPLKQAKEQLYSQLDQATCVANYRALSLSDFSQENWAIEPKTELLRLAALKKEIPRVEPNKFELIFTNASWENYRPGIVINQLGEKVSVDGSFVSLILQKVPILSPTQALVLFSQLYYADRLLPQQHTWEWLMALTYNPEASTSHVVSIAGLMLAKSGLLWSSFYPLADGPGLYFRLAL